MKIRLLGLLVMILSLNTGCKGQSDHIKFVTTATFQKELKNHPGSLVDVRTVEEAVNGMIEGAVLLDIYEDNFKSEISKLDKSRPVYIYCAAGGRSEDAGDMMSKMGFKQIIVLEGGFRAWKASGLPIFKPDFKVPGQ